MAFPESISPAEWVRLYQHARVRKAVAGGACVLAFAALLAALIAGNLAASVALLLGGLLTSEALVLASVQLRRLVDERPPRVGAVRPSWTLAQILDVEPGYGLSAGQQRYRRWLWMKRLIQVVVLSMLVEAMRSIVSFDVAGAAICLACVLGVALEQRLQRLRSELGLRRSAGLADLELGACITAGKRA